VDQHKTLLPLELVRSGEWAEIQEVVGRRDLVSRMAELGLRAGSRLRVLRQGRTCLLQLAGARLSLRSDDETRVLVRPLALAV
jgi:Fe2+ transport system protein FeoA